MYSTIEHFVNMALYKCCILLLLLSPFSLWLINVFQVLFPFFRHPQYFFLSFGGIHVCIQVIVGPCFGDSYVLFCFLLSYIQLCFLHNYPCQRFSWSVSLFESFPDHPCSTIRSLFPASYFQMFSVAISHLAVWYPQSLSPSPSLTLFSPSCLISSVTVSQSFPDSLLT